MKSFAGGGIRAAKAGRMSGRLWRGRGSGRSGGGDDVQR